MSNSGSLLVFPSIHENIQTDYGIVFCITGREQSVAQCLESKIPGINALSPIKLRYRRIGMTIQEEKVTIFPGYVFIRTIGDVNVLECRNIKNVLRLLYTEVENKEWRLSGYDRAIVEVLFRRNGVIGAFKAFFDEQNQIHILDSSFENTGVQILRVNKRAKTVEIRVYLAERSFDIWVSYEEVTRPLY